MLSGNKIPPDYRVTGYSGMITWWYTHNEFILIVLHIGTISIAIKYDVNCNWLLTYSSDNLLRNYLILMGRSALHTIFMTFLMWITTFGTWDLSSPYFRGLLLWNFTFIFTQFYQQQSYMLTAAIKVCFLIPSIDYSELINASLWP